MRYVAYYRVSTKKQGASGLGLAAQKHSVQQFVNSEGGELVAEYTEVESGRKSDRPELEQAIIHCELSGDTLVIAKLDRLSRDVEFLAMLENSDLKFIAADMPHANEITRGLMAQLAQYEAKLISERTKAGLAAAKARGQTLGNPALDLVRNTDTTAATRARQEQAAKRNAKILTFIKRLEAEAGETLPHKTIAEKLNAAGCTTSRNKPFTATQIHRVRKTAAT